MHKEAIKYKLCDFGDPTCKLNAFIFAFETGIAQGKDEW